MKLLQAGHAVVALAASTDDTRYILNSVCVEETDHGMKSVATDGRMLAIVEDKTEKFKAEEYPANVISSAVPNGAKSALVPIEVFIRAFKGISKKVRIPVLRTVAIAMGATDTTLGTTDLTSPQVQTTQNVPGVFPNYEAVIPKGTPTLAIKFSPILLRRALKIAENFGLRSVKLEFTGELAPVKITGETDDQTLTLVVMPVQ